MRIKLIALLLILAAAPGLAATWTLNEKTEKTTLDDADILPIEDSLASWAIKKVSYATLKANLQSVFYTESEVDAALANKQDDLDVPSQAEAEAGVATTERVWTAQRVAQAIAALAGGGTDDQNASEVPVTDSGGNYVGTDTEAVLAEIATMLNSKYESGDNVTLGTISAGASGFAVDDDGDVTGKSFSVAQNSTGPQVMTLFEDSDNGANYVGVASPSSNANDLILLLPTSDPTTGQVLTCAAPTSVTFSDGVARDASVCSWADNSGGLANVVEDTTPQLGGDLDIQTNSIEGVDATEFGYLDGVTGDIQTQLAGKAGEIASGTATLGTSAIADGACATVVTVSATGVATTDTIVWSFNADPSSTTGYNPTGDLLYIVDYPTANNVNFKVCNKSGSSITPGAITLNWRVDR